LIALLADRNAWEETVLAQTQEIRAYAARGYERVLQERWQRLAPAGAPAPSGGR
jgi:hypothetical protein